MNWVRYHTMTFLYTMAQAFALMVPAYAANMAPSIIRGKKPLDFGKNFFDGRRIFGDGKTFRGFFVGVVAGIITAVIFGPLYELLTNGLTAREVGKYMFLGFLLGFGAVFGDLCGSFVKRRLNVERGKSFPVLDQLDYVLGVVFVLWLIWSPVPVTISLVIALLLISGPLHVFGNVMAYKLGNKKSWY